ncbi:MAG: hypothetical protein ACO1PI_11405 [Bacteroidota bacterium]
MSETNPYFSGVNIFKPYTVVEDSPERLHLTESKNRRVFLYIFFRIYLFVLLILLGVVAVVAGQELPIPLIGALLILVLVLIVLLLKQKVVYEVCIEQDKITITYNRLAGNVTRELPITTADYIRYSHRGGRGGGMFYDLMLKDGSKHRIISIPILYMDTKRHEEIARRISSITGLEIKK